MLLRRSISRWPVTLCALALGAAGCGLFGHDDPTVPSVQSSPAIVVAPGPIPATVAALPTLDVAGFHALVEQAKGTPLVVNFWASWCGPCVDEAPLLAEAARTHRDIQFLGVDILDDRGGAQRFIREHDIPYPSVFDPPGDIRTDAGSEGQPVTLFIAADGLQVAKVDGQLDADSLRHNLSLLAG